VGFGEAGSEIIAENMGKGGDVDPMLPGKKLLLFLDFVLLEFLMMQLRFYNKVLWCL